MKSFVQPGNVITIPAPAATTSGDIVIVGELVGVACGHAAAAAPLDLALSGVYELPKVAADAVTVGAAIYYDATAKLLTTDDNEGANEKVGAAVAAAASATGSVKVRIQP